MNCQAYLKDDVLCVNLKQSSMIYSELQFLLGSAVTDFSVLPERITKNVLWYFRAEFLLSMEKQETEEELLDTLKQYVINFGRITPYFIFYMDIYVIFLLCLREQRSEAPEFLRSFLLNRGFFRGKGWDIEGIDFTDISESSLLVAAILVEDIKDRQSLLKEDFDAIAGGAEDFADLTAMQRLYMLSKQGRNYLSGEFKTTLAPNYPEMPNGDLEKIKYTLLENKVDIVEMVAIQTLDDLLGFEMYHTLKSDMRLRKCKHCGEYFIVRGRIDTEYCDRIKEGETKPCSLIGAARNYWGSKADDPIHAEFQKAYKRNHSRQRYGKMTQTEFYEWSEEARKKRSKCEAGQISLAEFKLWLGNKK